MHSFLCLFRECRLTTASVLIHWKISSRCYDHTPGLVVRLLSSDIMLRTGRMSDLREQHRVWPNPLPICSVIIFLQNKGNRKNTSRRKGRPMLFESLFVCLLFVFTIWSLCGKCEDIPEVKGTVLLEV